MTVDQRAQSNRAASCASLAFRVGGVLIILTCLLASLANPDPSHPKAAIKHKRSRSHHPRIRRDTVRSINSTKLFNPIDLVLPQFPTLQTALDTSQVVVLYFGASWCRQSKPVTAMMDQVLGPKLQQASTSGSKRQPLSVIYVSSDANIAQYRDANRNRFWSKVPFQSAERKLLKKQFKVCAKREMEKLQIQRKHEIPFMLVFSGKTHKIVSRKGVEELKKLGPGVLDYWANLVRGTLATAK